MPYSNSISDNKSLKVLLMGADITRGISPVSPFMLFPAAQPAPLQSSAAVPPSLPCLHPLPGAACSCVSQRGFQEALAMVEQRRHGLYHEPDHCISRFPIPALGFFYHIPTYSVNLILELQSKNSSSSMWIKLFVRLFVFILSGVSRVQINTKEDLAM